MPPLARAAGRVQVRLACDLGVVSLSIRGDTIESSLAPLASNASGRFLIRLDPDLHAALRSQAAARHVSLNELCARTLAEHAFDPATGSFGPVVRRAIGLFGDALIGLVAFGSWARGDAAPGSDVDVLVVVAPGIDLTRELYRRWDAEPVTYEGRAVDPHFIVLPDAEASVSGVWAEAARDGIVVFERGLQVSRHLGHVRRQVLSGVQRRSTAHGQPYWAMPSLEVADAKS